MAHLSFSLPVLGLGAAIIAFAANAQSVSKGDLAISHPWARETAAGQTAGGGFLTITNKGKTEDRLTGGTTAAAAQVQIHTMSMDGGIMRMRPLKDGLAIPAGGTATLKPGSFHIMFIGLKRPFKQGEMIPVTLTFAHAGKVDVQFKVEPVTFGGQSHDHH